MKPLDPHKVSHYLAACAALGSHSTATGPELRALIEQLSTLSVPDAVRVLRKRQHDLARKYDR